MDSDNSEGVYSIVIVVPYREIFRHSRRSWNRSLERAKVFLFSYPNLHTGNGQLNN